MFMVKVLERKGVIQLFGVALVLAPFCNMLIAMAMAPDLADRWTFTVFWKIMASISFPRQILNGLSLIVGAFMLRGRQSTWKFTLALLGGHIILQFLNFAKPGSTDWVSWVSFTINTVLFLFIADQLVWKQKFSENSEAKPTPVQPVEPLATVVATATPERPRVLPPVQQYNFVQKPVLPPVQSIQQRSRQKQPRKQVTAHFTGVGAWAKLSSISQQGIYLRAHRAAPAGIAERAVEFSLVNGLVVRARLAKQEGPEYFFEFSPLNDQQISLLNMWLKQQRAA